MPRRRRRFRLNYPLLWTLAAFGLVIALYIGVGVWSAWLTTKPGHRPSALYLAFVAKCLDATLAIWFFAVGSSIGSFLNVVAYRLPLGKTLGGHSACPYCTTPIKTSDNIPVLAWLRLRGRCRACRLPISIQYPLVELAVGLVFLSFYFTEFGIAGSNLPGSRPRPQGLGLVWMSVSNLLIVRVILHAYLVSGMIAAALMIVRHSRPPFSLYLWLALPLVVAAAIYPGLIVLPASGWQTGGVITHFDMLLTLACGLAGGLVTSALTVPLIVGLGNSDNPVGPEASSSTRQSTDPSQYALAWIGTTLCLGLLLGWQAVPGVASLVLLLTLGLPNILSLVIGAELASAATLREPVTWAWLGLVLYRAGWKWIEAGVSNMPLLSAWGGPGALLVVAIALAWLVGRARQAGLTHLHPLPVG